MSLQANVFPYGGVAFQVQVRGHFPTGADSGDVTTALRQLDPRVDAKGGGFRISGEPIPPSKLLSAFAERVVGGLFPDASFGLDRRRVYSVLLLTKISPKPVLSRDRGPMAGLSRGISDWASLSDDILETYEDSDYGLFKRDACFVRRNGILAYLPEPSGDPSGKVRTKRVLSWLVNPAELASLQLSIADAYVNELTQTRAELLTVKLDTLEKLKTFLKTSFLQLTPLLFLRDHSSFPEGFSAGQRKLYHLIAAASGTDARLADLRNAVDALVQESETWDPPVLSALSHVIGAARKFVGV